MEPKKIMQIVKHPHPVLKQVCAPVTVFDKALSELAASMLYTIGSNEEHRDPIGVGLAAPQVNAPIRLVVIAAMGYQEMALVNPLIERGKGEKLGKEGCLSLPHTHGDVLRFTDIWVSYQDLTGKQCRLKARDFLARVIQHEVDHLDALEFTDRIAQQKELCAV